MSCTKNTSAHPHNDKSLFGFNFESKKSSSTENISCILMDPQVGWKYMLESKLNILIFYQQILFRLINALKTVYYNKKIVISMPL